MQSYQAQRFLESHDTSSFVTLVENLKNQIQQKIIELDQVFLNALEGKKGDQPEQLMYAALRPVLFLCCGEVAHSESLDALSFRFEELKGQLKDLTEQYFLQNQQDIFKNFLLLKKMKIKNGDHYQFDKEKFYASLAKEKKQLFPELIDAFKVLAVHSYLLTQMIPRTKVSLLIRVKNEALVPTYYECINRVGNILNSEFNFSKDICNESNDEMDKVFAEVKDRSALNRNIIFRKNLTTNKKHFYDSITSGLLQIKEKYSHLFLEFSKVQQEIKQYDQQYNKVWNSVVAGDYSVEDFERIYGDVEKNHQELVGKINRLEQRKTKDLFKKKKTELIGELIQEAKEIPNKQYHIEEKSKAALIAIDHMAPILKIREKIKRIDELYAMSGSSQMMSGLIVTASNILVQVIDNLKSIQETLSFGGAISKKRVGLSEVVLGDIKKIKENASAIIASGLSLKKTYCHSGWFKTNEEWKDVGKSVEKILMVDEPFVDQVVTKGLIEAEIAVLKKQIEDEIVRYDAIRRSNFTNLQDRIMEARNVLEDHEKDCLKLLSEIEHEEYERAFVEAKSRCLGEIQDFQDEVEKGKTPFVPQTILSDPGKLLDLFLEKNQNQDKKNHTSSLTESFLVDKLKSHSLRETSKMRKAVRTNTQSFVVVQSKAPPQKKITFWQRHKKKILIGAFLGLCAFKLCLTIAALILVPEITLPALFALGAAVIAKFGLAATVGTLIAFATTATMGGLVTASSLAMIQDACRSNKIKTMPTPNTSTHGFVSGCIKEGISSQQNVSSSIHAGTHTFHTEKKSLPIEINKACEFEKALARKIVLSAWSESRLTQSQVLTKMLDDIDHQQAGSEKIFIKNWKIPERQEEIKLIMRELLQKTALNSEDFSHSFLKDYVADFFPFSHHNTISVMKKERVPF